jgi:predicted nucleic acid-binding protein
MSDSCFVDTNILVYLRDASERTKQKRAEEWMQRLWRDRSGRLSFQVLTEYYAVVTQRLKPGLPRDEARRDVRNLLAWAPVVVDANLVDNAWSLQERFDFSWWDALIVAAAQRAGCRYLLTEDLHAGLQVDALTVVNPFTSAPADVL